MSLPHPDCKRNIEFLYETPFIKHSYCIFSHHQTQKLKINRQQFKLCKKCFLYNSQKDRVMSSINNSTYPKRYYFTILGHNRAVNLGIM